MRRLSIYGCLLFVVFPLCAQSGDTAPSIISRSEPTYSAEAAQARVQSTVTLSIVVGEDGKARDFHVTQGAGFGLDEKAIESVGAWVFQPATKNGVAVPAPANVELTFNMLVKDQEDHSGQRSRLNFTLPPAASRPVLIVGKLPGNPSAPGDQSLKFHLQVDSQGAPKNVSVISSTDPSWEKQVQRVLQTWRFRPALVNGNPVVAEGVFEMTHTGPLDSAGTIVVRNAASDEDTASVRRVVAPLPVAGLLPRVNHTATLLKNGTVLLAGGSAHDSEVPPGTADFHALNSAQIFDWATRKIVKTGDLVSARSNHSATLLADGTVLLAAGETMASGAIQPLASAEIFDPSTGRFAATGNLHEIRTHHVAVALPDGRVLICGGMGAGDKYLASAEIYDRGTRSFSPAGNMTTARTSFRAVGLKDGRVLLVGGVGPAGGTAEIYDPVAKAFRATGKMTIARYGFSATLLGNGQVLIAGGSTGSDAGPATSSAELFDPATGTFHPTGAMADVRTFHNAVALSNGGVLISGGLPGAQRRPLAATEIFDPVGDTFGPGPTLTGIHIGHTATLLDDGNVLIAGSGLIGNGSSAELLALGTR